MIYKIFYWLAKKSNKFAYFCIGVMKWDTEREKRKIEGKIP